MTADERRWAPGEIIYGLGDIEINAGAQRLEMDILNTGDRPIQVGSHVHLPQSNAALQFDRASAHGRRLDIPAGTAARFEPGDSKTVRLIALTGSREVFGLSNAVNGSLTRAQPSEGGAQ